MTDVLRPRKYPGRQIVLSRDDARDVLYRRRLSENGPADRFACINPYLIEGIGLPSMLDADRGRLPVQLQSRCRQCEPCFAHRRRLWTARAVDEISVSNRTWFGTLTVEPHRRFQLEVEAETRLRVCNETLSDLTPSERYRTIANHLGKEVTRWLKRLRKTGSFRYLLVFEAHKDGYPHCHILLHETAQPLRKKDLEAQWKYGFSNWRLVNSDRRAAVYVCKYLNKSSLTRVRGSQHYGQATKVAVLTERLNAVLRT